jgi:hypothetical protein
MKIQIDNIAKVFLLISIIVFILSLTQNTYCTSSSDFCDDSPGWLVLLIGIIGVFVGGACLSWLANPFILVSWIIFKDIKYSFIFSLLAVISSGSFLLFNQVIVDEAGNYAEITSYKIGYWLWFSSMIIMLIGNIVRLLPKVLNKTKKISM